MQTIAIIGLGSFGCRMTDALSGSNAELIIIDKDREIVEKYKSAVTNAYIADALGEEILKKVISKDVNVAIIDLGSQLESSIMVTNHLKKIGIEHIIVRARSNEHGEILKLVGATKVIYPDLDAAVHLVPMILSESLFNYMPVSQNFSIAEIKIKDYQDGKTLAESRLRQDYGLNIIGFHAENSQEIQTITSADFVLSSKMIFLVAGTPDSIMNYTKSKDSDTEHKKSIGFFQKLFHRN